MFIYRKMVFTEEEKLLLNFLERPNAMVLSVYLQNFLLSSGRLVG